MKKRRPRIIIRSDPEKRIMEIPRPRIIIRSEELIPEKRIMEILAFEETREQRLFDAITQMLETARERAADAAVDPDHVADGMAPFYSGGLKALRDFEEFLHNTRAEAIEARLRGVDDSE